MPRVPVLDAPQVQARPLPTPAVREGVGAGAGEQLAGEALQQVGADTTRLGNQLAALDREARQKANAVAEANASTEFEKSINAELYDREKGVLLTQGQAAAQASMGVYERLEKRRQELLSKGLFNDDQRRAFDMRSRTAMAGVQRTVEDHVGKQLHVARVASANALAEESLTAVTNAYADDRTFAEKSAAVEPSLRALALSPEDGEAKVLQWRAAAAKARINQALALQDGQTAQALLSRTKDVLGPHAPQLQHDVTVLLGAQEADRTRQDILGRNTDPRTGYVDGQAALQEAYALPAEKPWKKDLISQIESDISRNTQLAKQEAAEVFDKALVVMQESNSLSSPAMAEYRAWLTSPLHAKAGGGEYWNKLKEQYATDNRAERSTRAQEKQAQKEADKLALEQYMSLPLEDRSQLGVTDAFAGQGVSRLGLATITAQQRKDKDAYAKGLAPGERDFNAMVDSASTRTKYLNGNDPNSKENRVSFKAHMQDWYASFPADKKPTREEVRKEIARSLRYEKNQGFFKFGGVFKFQEVPGQTYKKVDQSEEPYPDNREESAPASAPAPAPDTAPPQATQGEQLVPVIGPKGQKRRAPAQGLDEWLKQNPGWRRR